MHNMLVSVVYYRIRDLCSSLFLDLLLQSLYVGLQCILNLSSLGLITFKLFRCVGMFITNLSKNEVQDLINLYPYSNWNGIRVHTLFINIIINNSILIWLTSVNCATDTFICWSSLTSSLWALSTDFSSSCVCLVLYKKFTQKYDYNLWLNF